MRYLRMMRWLLSLSIIALSVQCAAAQDNPNFEIGLKPFGSYNMGNIDNVNLGNGSLGVDIPLISYPQRGGKLKLDLSLHYFNGAATGQDVCYPPYGCYFFWGFSQAALSLIDKGAVFESGYLPGHPPDPTLVIAEPDGATHLVGALTGATNLLESVDGTAYRGVWNPNTGYYTSITDSQGTIYQPGTQYCYYGFPGANTSLGFESCELSREDANGNQISFSSATGWVDTTGRTISMPSESTNSSNFTGCTGAQPVSFVVLWNPPGINGGTYPLKFCFFTASYPQVTVGVSYNQQGQPIYQYNPYNTSLSELESIVLPNNTTWTFDYVSLNVYPTSPDPEDLPTLSQITFPTGGTLSYTWTTSMECPTGGSPINFAVASRTMNPNDGLTPASTWSYGYGTSGGNPTVGTNTITDPVGNQSVNTFGLPVNSIYYPNSCYLYESQAQHYQGSQSGGNLLKTKQTYYSYLIPTSFNSSLPVALNVVPVQANTVWGNGLQSQVLHTYDNGFQFQAFSVSSTNYHLGPYGTTYTGTYGRELTKQEYDYGNGAPGSLLRTTTTSYLAFSNSSYLTANLLDLPSSVQVTGSGPGSLTDFGYDAAGGVHGNLTSTARWLNTTSSYLTTSNVYDSYGRVTSTTDPKLNPTTFGYTPSACPSGSGYAGSGPTSVTNALNQTTYYCYDLNTGLLTQTTDLNGLATSYTYDDVLRTLAVNNPDGGQSTFCYTDTGSESGGGTCGKSSSPYEVVISEKINSSTNRVSTLQVDGVGREIREAVTNGETKPYDEVDTCYEGNGRISFKSYAFQDTGPFATSRTCASPEAGDSFAYEGLGRATKVTHSDSSYISTSYTGNTASVTDEQNKTRESLTDGLGRLEEVIENPGGLGYVTNYGYDALDNLTTVIQNSSRNRTFVYDSLGRLTSSTNPESNYSPANQTYLATTYAYDADGNLVNKTEPAQNQQGTATVTLTYCYDALGRMIAKAYTLQPCTSTGGRMATPLVSYVYDGAALPSAPAGCTLGSFSYGFAIGRRTAMCEGTGEVEGWSYSITSGQGWKTADQRTTDSLTKTATYQYNFLGSPTSITYPSSRVITYAYNLGDQPTSATDQTTLVNYANTVHYWAGGSPCWAAYGAAISAAETYNPRLQPLNMQATGSVISYPGSCSGLGQTGNLLDLSYNFNLGSGDNGNVMGITNNMDGTRSQNLAYDVLNRILSAQTSSTYATSHTHCWGETYQFDGQTTGGAWGTLSAITQMTGNYTGCTGEVLAGITVTAQNRISNGSTYYYDTAGNMTTNSGVTNSYDAENHLVSSAGVTYTYDGDGKRVEKTTSGTPYKLYWYGLDGNVLDETDQTGSAANSNFSEYVFFGGQRIGRRDYSNNVYYYASDHLGTSRVMAEVPSGSTTATLCYDADFYPFGGERAYTNTCGQAYKFTGKERDSESNLDNFGARYNSSSLGRFMSPDSGRFRWQDPQTLNRYTYTRNNPLKFIDPTGKYFVVSSDVQPQVRQYISTLLRSDSGRALVNQISSSPRANFINSGNLPRTQLPNNQVSVTNGTTTALPGNTPGSVAGTTTTLDFSNISFTAGATGQTDFFIGLKAFTHEDFHISDMNAASTLQGAVAAGAAGDAPSQPGASDTTGGTAESRALQVLLGLGGAGNSYSSNDATDQEANQVIAYGQVMHDAQSAASNAQVEPPAVNQQLCDPSIQSNCP